MDLVKFNMWTSGFCAAAVLVEVLLGQYLLAICSLAISVATFLKANA